MKRQHNHEWLDSIDNQLFHPNCDPRILQDTCPACREFMANWAKSIQNITDSGE